MSETQQSQKKNKKKKKANKINGNVHEQKNFEESAKENDVQKPNAVFAAALPQKVGLTTTFNDVEVTLMKNENEVTNGIAKKKKKKKKKQQQSAENAVESSQNEEDNQNLLNFKENHIELVNHPEISVTISAAPPVISKETIPEDKNNSVNDKKEVSEAPNLSSAKKKKKKKKKKAPENESTPTPSAPVQANDESTPTYVKLPADGGNCVLLVSHDSFSSASRQAPDNASVNSKGNVPMVVLKNPELKKSENSAAAQNENSSSVSIFPVYSDSSKGEKKKADFNVDSSLDKISNMIKNKEENPETENAEIVNTVDENAEENKPTKAQLKAERRAKQEAQRAAKLAKSADVKDPKAKSTDKDPKAQSSEQTKVITKSNEQPVSKPITKDISPNKVVSKAVEQEMHRKVQIFSHLPQYKDLLSKKTAVNNSKIPPPILELGSHYAKGLLFGSNARCVGFLGAVRQVILDYKTPATKTLSKDFESKLQTYFDYLNNCRPLSVNIVNAMKFLKHHVNHIPEGMDDTRAKESLCQSINDYVREEILLAKEAITISASAKIVNNDTILVFAYSSLVKDVLCKAHEQNKKFHVIVVDSRAKLEGLEMLRRLVKHGLQCSYISINAVSYVIKKVNKVIIGAHALLANGFVMSRLGCKILSLVGSTNSVPVLVCCETYKFWERTLTDSIVHNELGNPDDLVTMSLDKKDSLLKWQDLSSLQIYNLLYDVTPSDFISVVITEKGLIPCTSVPVLLRVKHAGLQE